MNAEIAGNRCHWTPDPTEPDAQSRNSWGYFVDRAQERSSLLEDHNPRFTDSVNAGPAHSDQLRA